MTLSKNIARTGRVLRFLAGAVLLLTGILGLWLQIPGGGWGARVFLVLLILAGAFAMLEGAIGWCALRAFGFKTRL